jgi:hypothetical protein
MLQTANVPGWSPSRQDARQVITVDAACGNGAAEKRGREKRAHAGGAQAVRCKAQPGSSPGP